MSVIRQQDAPLEEGKAQGINAELGAYAARLLSDAGGLTQFGAFVETLPPGSFSSHKHWHEREDEFVFVITGTVTLNEGGRLTEMRSEGSPTARPSPAAQDSRRLDSAGPSACPRSCAASRRGYWPCGDCRGACPR